jgi:epoxyqueuosine reductase QueG
MVKKGLDVMARTRCYYCGIPQGILNTLNEYPVENMNSIYACDYCETRSNWNAVFLTDKNDINTRNIGGGHEG